MSQQKTSYSREFILGVISVFLIMVAVGSVMLKVVGGDFGAAPDTQTKSTSAESAKVYSKEALSVGKEIYDMACIACHTPGMAGAPKFGDKASWAGRIAKGDAVLISNAINGFNGMPPRGGRSELSDEEIEWAVGYMLGSF